MFALWHKWSYVLFCVWVISLYVSVCNVLHLFYICMYIPVHFPLLVS